MHNQSVSPRSMRIQNPSPDDAVALMRGAGFVVKLGKQTICYCQSEREAVNEAVRKNGVAYKISRDKSQLGRSAQISLIEVETDYRENKPLTPSESIADFVREQIGATYGPMSPLAKQRVVLTIFPVVNGDKDLAFDSYLLLYPSSSRDQFDRFWYAIDNRKDEEPKKEIKNSTRESLVQYAESHGLSEILFCLLNKDIKECMMLVDKNDYTSYALENLIEKARILGEIDQKTSDEFKEKLSSYIASKNVEKRIGGDILSVISKNQIIASMIRNGNDEGIADFLSSMGYDKNEARELSYEIISLSNMLKRSYLK